MIRDGEVYIFSTGRKLHSQSGSLAVKPRERAEPWETRLCDGYDSHLEEGEPPTREGSPACRQLSAAERRELADHMIREWDEWARELEGQKTTDVR